MYLHRGFFCAYYILITENTAFFTGGTELVTSFLNLSMFFVYSFFVPYVVKALRRSAFQVKYLIWLNTKKPALKSAGSVSCIYVSALRRKDN